MKNSLVVLLFLLSISTPYAQDTINVPFDYPTIQEGINASVNGDVVLIHPGSYYENINFSGKLITVASLFLTTQDTNYIFQTVIEGDTCETVIFESGENSAARLIGFTFQNAHILLNTSGVIYCVNSSPLIMNNRIINNTVGNFLLSINDGGGIACIDASPIIRNNNISNNHITGFGGGIYCYNSSPTIIDNIIQYDSVSGGFGQGLGGGIYCDNSSPNIVDNYITDNYVGGWSAYGGGIYCTNSSPDIVDNLIKNNIVGGGSGSFGGGGIYCTDSSSATITNNIISNNIAQGSDPLGAGIFCNGASVVTITGNNIIANGDFGIYSKDFSSAIIINNLISENFNFYGGWGIGCFSSIMTLKNNTIMSNGNQPGSSGGILCGQGSFLTIDSCVLSDNNGSGVCSMDYGDVSIIGIHNCNITGNSLYGVVNHTGVIINAEYNWWGDVSGPGGAGPGQGDSVSQNVDYEPWLINPITEVEELRISSTPNEYQLYQNYPNPFNHSTKIKYSIPQSSRVVIKVFGILGNEIETLVKEEKGVGTYEITWYADNLPSGIYFYRLQSGDFVSTKKMILLK